MRAATSKAAQVARVTKRCNGCGKDKEVGAFSLDRHKADGLTTRCRQCRNESARTQAATRVADVMSVAIGAETTTNETENTVVDIIETSNLDAARTRRAMRRQVCDGCHENRAVSAFPKTGPGTWAPVCRRCNEATDVSPPESETAPVGAAEHAVRALHSQTVKFASVGVVTDGSYLDGMADGLMLAFETFTGRKLS